MDVLGTVHHYYRSVHVGSMRPRRIATLKKMRDDIEALTSTLKHRFSDAILQCSAELVEIDTGEHPFWYTNVFIGLALQTTKMQEHLRRAYTEGDVNYCAWAARNLIELRIWTLYVTESNENVWRFHQDQHVDGLSLVRTIEKAAQKLHSEGDAQFLKRVAAALRPAMEEHAATTGVSDRLPFLNPKQVSKQFNLEGEFELYNVLYSKLLHATGLSVLVVQDKEMKAKTIDGMFSYAATCALTILERLNHRLRTESLPTFEYR